MYSASAVRVQIEAALERRIPSALTPAHRAVRPVSAVGIPALDDLLHGGLPTGGVTELVGPECSGRTSVALSFVARLTQAGKICAWIDAGNAFDPLSAAATGVDLDRLLWVRCGATPVASHSRSSFTVPAQYLAAPPAKKGLHGGGFGPHPRTEANGLSTAIGDLFDGSGSTSSGIAPRGAEPRPLTRIQQRTAEPFTMPARSALSARTPARPWSRIEQALRVVDLLLQSGGFSALVMDMGGLAPEFVSRVPLATWYRFRAAADRTQSSILLLTQYACAKSSAELVLDFHPAQALCDEPTMFMGIRPHVEISRHRFTTTQTNVVALRKPPRSVQAASWTSRSPSVGPR